MDMLSRDTGIPGAYKLAAYEAQRPGGATNSREALKEVCREFEAIFMNYLLKKMRDTVPRNGFFEQGVSYDIIQSMHDEALSVELARGGGIGLADQLYTQLSKYI